MRLTLRTLLGYLDDILEPQHAREIGEKINESGFASTLVARIKDVLRRRRITAPEPMGPGSDPDPNVVAEYLDNTLSPEKVEDLERLCLESDIHLAEVAACHQILTLVLGEPVDIPAEVRERTYALGTLTPPASNGRGLAAERPPVPGQMAAAATAPPPSTLPEYLKPRSGLRRLVPIAALLLIGAVWLGLIFSDPANPWRGGAERERSSPDADTVALADQAADRGADNAATVVPPAPRPRQGSEVTNVPMPPPAGEAPAASPPMTSSPSPMPEPAPSINPPPPPDQPEAGTTAPIPSPATLPPMPQPTTVEAPQATPMPPEPAPPTPPAASVVDTHRVLYNSSEGVLLQAAANDQWMVLPRRALVHPGEELSAPYPFESLLQIDDTGATVVLMGDTRVRLLPSAPPAALSLDVERARVIFRRPAVGGADSPFVIGLTLAGTPYTLELLEPGTECGLAVSPRLAEGLVDPLPPPSCDGALVLTSGSALLTGADGVQTLLKAGSAFLELMDGKFLSTAGPLAAPPEWMVPLSGAAQAVARSYALQFEREFRLDQPAGETIPALVESRHPRLSQLATQTLALTGAYRSLVRALRAPHEEARQAAITGLGVWLRENPDRSELLSDEVFRTFRQEDAEVIMRLVWGFPPAAAQDPELSRELVAWLLSEDVAVRELAFFRILRLTREGVTYGYHPDAPEMQRTASVRFWEDRLRKRGALVAPPPPMPAVP